MTTLNEAREAVYDRFRTLWADRTPFTFQNDKFESKALKDDWIRVSVLETFSAQETLGPTGARRFRRRGRIFGQLFTLAEEGGMANSGGHAHVFRGIFEATSFGGVDCNNAVVDEVGPDGKWHQTNISIIFDYEEFK